jgi:tetratricopeptide (TPR) repeat protein
MSFIGAQITALSIVLFYLSNICNAQSFDDKYHNSGLAYAVQGKLEEAKKDFHKSLELDDDYQPAEKALRIIMDVSNNKIAAEIAIHIFKGIDHRTKGELDKAIAELNTAVMLNSAYSPSYNERGFAYYRMGEYKLAVDDFERAIKIEPGYIDAYYNRGIAYHLNRDYKKAWKDIEKA